MRVLLILLVFLELSVAQESRPNILWIWAEDMSPLAGAYGARIDTPHLDRLAKEGVLFERAFTPTPVCSTCRSSMMVGAYATTFGLHNHRSSRTKASRIHLPEGVRTFPELLRGAGYYTFNLGGKHDYNFVHDKKAMFDSPDGRGFYRPGKAMPWRNRAEGQPFFGIIQVQGGKERRKPPQPTSPGDVRLPRYYPDDPTLKSFFAYQYDCARVTDADVGAILAELRKDGLGENTLVVFHSDHGMRCLRDKQFCYDGGLRVPMIARWPARKDLIPPGTRRSEIVAVLDLVATTLEVTGVAVPSWMECRSLLGKDYRPRDYVIGVRDRCDFTIDRIRTVRTDRYRYVRNGLTDRPYTQPTYKDGRGGVFAYVGVMKRLYAEGKLPAHQAWFMSPDRPKEELYDHVTDPDETVNLATDPKLREELQRHRTLLDTWIATTGDKGQRRESDAGLLAVLRQWRDRCVNPEYDALKKKHPELTKPKR